MAQKLGNILNPMLTALGIDTTQKQVIDLLSADISVDDALAKQVSDSINNIVTIESAKTNPAVAAHFKSKHFAEALNGADARLKAMMDELELPDEAKSAILAVDGTYNRMEAYNKAVKANLEAKLAGATKGEKADLLKKIEDMNKEMLANKAAFEAEKANLLNQHKQTLSDFQLNSLLNGKKWANEKMGEDMNRKFAINALKEQLQKDGALLSFDDTTGLSLKDSKTPDLPFHKENKPVSLEDYLSKFLVDGGLIITTDPAKPIPGNNPTIITPPVAGGPPPLYSEAVLAKMAETASAVAQNP